MPRVLPDFTLMYSCVSALHPACLSLSTYMWSELLGAWCDGVWMHFSERLASSLHWNTAHLVGPECSSVRLFTPSCTYNSVFVESTFSWILYKPVHALWLKSSVCPAFQPKAVVLFEVCMCVFDMSEWNIHHAHARTHTHRNMAVSLYFFRNNLVRIVKAGWHVQPPV